MPNSILTAINIAPDMSIALYASAAWDGSSLVTTAVYKNELNDGNGTTGNNGAVKKNTTNNTIQVNLSAADGVTYQGGVTYVFKGRGNSPTNAYGPFDVTYSAVYKNDGSTVTADQNFDELTLTITDPFTSGGWMYLDEIEVLSSVDPFTTANSTQLAAGVAFYGDIITPSDTDIETIKVVIGGKQAGDKLLLDSPAHLINANITQANKTVGGISGVDYTFDATSNTLSITKNGGGAFTAAQVESIVEAIKLQNTESSPTNGERTATISCIDGSSNEGASALATISVHATAPTINGVTDNQADIVTNSTVTYTVVFSHALNQSTFTSGDIKVINPANSDITANWTIGTPATSDGITWTVAITPPTGANAINATAVRLKIEADSVEDMYGNTNAEFIQAISSQSFDTVAPSLHTSTVPAITNTGGGTGIGDTIILTLTFDADDVTGLTSGNDTSIFQLDGSAKEAAWGGSGATRTLTFTVGSGDSGVVTIDEAALKAALVAGITDGAGNAFTYTANSGNIADIAVDITVDSTIVTNNNLGTILTTQMATLTTLVNEVKVLATNNSGGSGSSTPASFVKPGS